MQRLWKIYPHIISEMYTISESMLLQTSRVSFSHRGLLWTDMIKTNETI